MSIITYPLDGVTYSAEDVATYLCTRTSGVYAKNSNFAASITGTRQVTIAPGLAWMNYDDFKGVSVCSREDTVLTVPDADNTLNRVDRVVLQFDTASNLTAIRLKTGTPAVAAQPPDILQNHNQYELGLCTISVPAGNAAITAADVTDTRADEDVCGVMRDGVTGIPTQQLVEQALAMMTQLSTELHTKLDALDEAIASVESGSFYTRAEADAKFGTPYSLPAATVSTLGGVKIGDYLDIAPDGTLSGKTLYDTIAASVAVKSEARLVWNTTKDTGTKWKTCDFQVPENVDYVCVKIVNSGSEKNLARGSSIQDVISLPGNMGGTEFRFEFQTGGLLRVTYQPDTTLKGSNSLKIYVTCYHYPTLAELLTETQASQADTDALAVDQEYRVAMLELGLTDDTTTDTT